MIIVFFHVIYLIGKMVYENYRCSRLRDTIEIKDVEEEPSRAPVIAKAANDQASSKYYDPLDVSYDDEGRPRAPKFSPPAYIQRYLAVIKVLSDPRYRGGIKKVVDYGCSELGFVTYLKHTPGIEEILCVDVDRNTLERHKNKAIPLNADYLRNRQHPLTIRVYEGSVTDHDNILVSSDAVVAIELIEHLYPDTLMDFPYNVFGFVRPLVAVVTTPNADFNVLFPDMKSQFRHWDHKFEWTRQQFEDWSRNIVSRYPEYEVTFEGVCAGPSGTEKYGCCSQMAVFRRTREPPPAVVYGREGLLKNVTTEEYPYRVDNRSDEEKILDEASYHIRQYAHNNPEGSEEYPLASLMRNVENFHVTSEVLREILVNGNWTIVDRENGPMIQCPEPSTFSDYDLEADVLEEGLDDEWVERIPAHLPVAWGGMRDAHVESAYDDECWDDDYDLIVPVDSLIDNSVDEHAVDLRIPPVEFSLTRSLETGDLDCIEIANASDVPSSLEDDRLSAFVSDPDENSSLAGNTSEPPSLRITRLDGNSRGNGELGSLCSIYLESSRNDEADTCPRDITNSSFDCTELQRSFEDEKRRDEKLPGLGRRFLAGVDHFEEPRSSSSPRVSLELRESADKSSNLGTSRLADSRNAVRPPEVNAMHVNDAELGVVESKTNDATILGDVVIRDDAEAVSRVAYSGRQKTPVSLRLRGTLCSSDVPRTTTCHQETPSITNNLEASRNCIEATKNAHGVTIPDVESVLEVTFAKDTKDSPRNWRKDEVAAPSPETPPGSWSPEIMDSGYPNTSSIQDTTPEYDLSSIAQDRISDSESPSVAEVPHAFLEPPVIIDEVENGDLANNNRDGEGNNVAADHYDPDDLQPLIDVLENDLENENDIYVLENDFPVWLLRILERGRPRPLRRALVERDERLPAVRLNVNAPGGQHEIAEPNVDDEGFTSSESDEEYDDDDAEHDDDDDDDDDGDGDDDDDNANGDVADDDGEDEDENVESGEDYSDWNMSGYQC